MVSRVSGSLIVVALLALNACGAGADDEWHALELSYSVGKTVADLTKLSSSVVVHMDGSEPCKAGETTEVFPVADYIAGVSLCEAAPIDGVEEQAAKEYLCSIQIAARTYLGYFQAYGTKAKDRFKECGALVDTTTTFQNLICGKKSEQKQKLARELAPEDSQKVLLSSDGKVVLAEQFGRDKDGNSGHGRGLDQNAALADAKAGMNCAAILAKYFQGARIASLPKETSDTSKDQPVLKTDVLSTEGLASSEPAAPAGDSSAPPGDSSGTALAQNDTKPTAEPTAPAKVVVSESNAKTLGVEQNSLAWVPNAQDGTMQLAMMTSCSSGLCANPLSGYQSYTSPLTLGASTYGGASGVWPQGYSVSSQTAAQTAADSAAQTQQVAASATVASSAETCNGRDDNANGQIDEGNPGGGASCTAAGLGQCKLGQLVCSGGTLRCQPGAPQAEACDGLDNDCDGQVDNGCSGAASSATCVPSGEICNGKDDDCNGVADEGNPGGGSVCAVPLADGSEGQGMVACNQGQLQCVPILGGSNGSSAGSISGNAGLSEAQMGCAVGASGAASGGASALLWGLALLGVIGLRRRRRRTDCSKFHGLGEGGL